MSDWVAHIRQIAGRWLTERALIQRETISVGAMGDSIRAWGTVASDVPCRVIVARRSDLSGQAVTADQETLDDVVRLAFPAGTAVDVDTRVIVGGNTYAVVRVETALTDDVFAQAVAVRKR